MKNPNCDNDKCWQEHGEIRFLPLGGDGNALLCRTCFNHEMAYRKARAEETKCPENFLILRWEDLDIYETD